MMKIAIQKSGVFMGHRAPVYALSLAEKQGTFFSSGGDGQVVRWRTDAPDQGFLLAQTPNPVYALCYLPHAKLLVVGQNFEGIHLIDLSNGKEAASLKLGNSAIFDIKSHHDTLYVACGDGHVYAIHLPSVTVKAKCRYGTQYARTLELMPENQEIAVGYSDSSIRILDMETLAMKQEILGHDQSVFSLAASVGHEYLLSGSRDAFLKMWKKNEEGKYALYASIVAHMYTVNHVAFRPDGKYFATCSKDKSIKVWETAEFKLLKVIDRARHAGHGTSINKLLWTSNDCLLAASDDRTISSWEILLEESK